MLQGKAESLKIKLKSATKLKLNKAKIESALRNTECILTEELRTIKAETEFMCLKLEDYRKEIFKVQSQITMIGICEVSEKTKFDNHISNLADHKSAFDKMFLKDTEAMEFKKIEIKKKEAEKKELEKEKQKIREEKNQLQLMEAETIEKECDAIEKECAVLKKRNKAIMLKLRRQLIESEDLRRNLMKNTEFSTSKEFYVLIEGMADCGLKRDNQFCTMSQRNRMVNTKLIELTALLKTKDRRQHGPRVLLLHGNVNFYNRNVKTGWTLEK